MVWNKSVFYWRCVLYRDHLFNRDMYGLLWKNDKTLIMLSIAMVVGCFVPVLLLPLILVYFLTIGMRAKRQRSQGRTFEFFAYYFIVDVLNIVFFFSFFPKTNPVRYRAVSKQTQLIESL